MFKGTLMPLAVGMIQTLGFPAVLAAADAMVKGGRVTLVYFDLAERGEFVVAVRGGNSEVQRAVDAGVAAVETVSGGKLVAYYVIPNPTENVETVLPLEFSEVAERFRT